MPYQLTFQAYRVFALIIFLFSAISAQADFPNQSYGTAFAPLHSGYLKGQAATGFQNQRMGACCGCG